MRQRVIHYPSHPKPDSNFCSSRESLKAPHILMKIGIEEDALMRDNHPPKSRKRIHVYYAVLTMCITFMATAIPSAVSAEATVKGSLIANGKKVELPYVYVWKKEEGFYKKDDPTWNIIFAERSLQPRELGSHVPNSAWVHIGITQTKEFEEQGKLEVYTQSIKFSATAAGNVSGGNYPKIEIKGLETGLVTGRVWHPEQQKVFDDSFQFDFAFSAPISDPNAPTIIGKPLPPGGGEPGQAYLKWTESVHTGDIELVKSLMPAEMADQLGSLSSEEARKEIEFMQMMTPKDNIIVGGSSDGETAILQTEGVVDGQKVSVEITMTKMGPLWVTTNASM